MARTSKKPHEAAVDDYPPRPLSEALADPAEIAAYENIQPDQIADYHEKHPTLKPGKAHDVEPPTEDHGDPVQ